MRDSKIKLLMGIPHPNARGGPPTHLPHLVQYFSEHDGYKVKTIFYGSKEFGTDRGRSESIIKKLFVTSGTFIEYLFYILFFRPNIIHLNTAFARLAIIRDVPFAILSRISGNRLILKLHGSHSEVVHTTSRVQKVIVRLLFWSATKVGVLSNTERQEIVKHFGYEQKVVIVKNIVDFSAPNVSVELFKKHGSEVCGLFVSRIEYRKGLQDLIRAIPLVRAQIPTFRPIVAGDGPDMSNCIDLANRLGVSQCVTWLGHVDNLKVQSLYRQCDFFVFPTHYPEGMPMVLIEALKSGIPCITTKVSFAASYMTDRKNCLFAAKNSPNDLADKLISLYTNRDLQKTMRLENPRFVKQFSQKNVGGEFEKLYEYMLKG